MQTELLKSLRAYTGLVELEVKKKRPKTGGGEPELDFGEKNKSFNLYEHTPLPVHGLMKAANKLVKYMWITHGPALLGMKFIYEQVSNVIVSFF